MQLVLRLLIQGVWPGGGAQSLDTLVPGARACAANNVVKCLLTMEKRILPYINALPEELA